MMETGAETPSPAPQPQLPTWREREPGEPPLGRTAAIERMRQAHAFRLGVQAELASMCIEPQHTPCTTCKLSESCNRMLSSLLIRTLNAATEQVREERHLLLRLRHDPRHARSFGAHHLAHEQLINDLSAHVMDWGRRSPGDVVSSTAALLKYWNEAHFATHDELLMAAAAGSPGAT